MHDHRGAPCGSVAMQGWRRPKAQNGTGIESGKSEHDRRRQISRATTISEDFIVLGQRCGQQVLRKKATSISGTDTIRKKWCVCLLYGSPCAPLLLPWLGEVQGTSMAMVQGKYSPVLAHIPMFRVPTVLLRVPSRHAGAADGRRTQFVTTSSQ